MIKLRWLDTDSYVFDAGTRHVGASVVAELEPVLRRDLPMLSSTVNVTIYPGTRVVPETGETGRAVAKDWIHVPVSPRDPRGVGQILAASFRGTLAHEAHHAARYATTPNADDGRVISVAVFEGLATRYQTEITAQVPPWGEYDPAEADDWIRELIALPDGTDTLHWRFHHPDGRRWIAYRAGTRLADRAVAAYGITAAEMVGMSTDEVLRLAGFTASAMSE